MRLPALALARRPRARDLTAYIIAFFAFTILRSVEDQTGIAVKAGYVLHAEKWLFAGTYPTEWLQRQFDAAGPVGALEIACLVVYCSYFLVPHAVAFVRWRTDPAGFRRYAAALILTLYVGLTVSLVVPTAPPWLADRYTDAPHVVRLIPHVVGWNPEDASDSGTKGNPVAATPSIHVALTVLVALALWRRRSLRLVGVAYALAMAFTLVYTGDHYVVDELLGAAVAVLAWLATARLERRAPEPASSAVP